MPLSQSFTALFRRRAQSLLSQHPRAYQRVLQWTDAESLEKRICLALVRQGDVAFDVGAGLGRISLFLSDVVGHNGEVHAFEPLPPIFAQLRTAIEQEKKSHNVFLNNLACAAHTCEIPLQAPNLGPGSTAGKIRPAEDAPAELESCLLPVQAGRLDDYHRGQSSERLDFVMCSVQGGELLVLRGMPHRLERFAPLLFLNVFAGWAKPFGYGPADLVDYLSSQGYDQFYLVTDCATRMTDASATLKQAAALEPASFICARGERYSKRLRHLDSL